MISPGDRLHEEQRQAIERFEAAYNAIDRHLRHCLSKDSSTTFSQLIKEYSQKNPFSKFRDTLRIAADLRNFLVHEKVAPFRHAAIPTEETVRNLEEIRDQQLNPKRVIPTYQKRVETLSPDESLAKVLKLISQRNYSQFPAYSDQTFKGLLTENGITRWLARHVAQDLSLVELEDVTVKQILPEEEKRSNWSFISKKATLEGLKRQFSENDVLEAVLITDAGKRSETPMGIVTRWDMVNSE